jgi:hypothetical protein
MGLAAPDARVQLDADSRRPSMLKLRRVSESGLAAVTKVPESESKTHE